MKTAQTLGRGRGWDEEITKQTGGFTSDQNLQTGAKQKQKLQPGPEEGRKRGPLSNLRKIEQLKKELQRGGGVESSFSSN